MCGLTSAAKAGVKRRNGYRSGEPLRHPKADVTLELTLHKVKIPTLVAKGATRMGHRLHQLEEELEPDLVTLVI
jgi:hypothetical protein